MKYEIINSGSEVWKPIEGFEGLYQISNFGKVKSLDRKVINNRTFQLIKGKILKPCNNGNNYLYIGLCKNGKIKRIAIHKLVAQAFIPNPNNLPQVNHKDENKLNNCVENLEWCTPNYNANYGNRNKKMKKMIIEKYAKKVVQYDINKNYITEYDSIEETARKNNVTSQAISRCCNGKLKKCKNYIFKFKSEVINDDL